MRFPQPVDFIAFLFGLTLLAEIAGAAPARRKPEVFSAVEGVAEGPRHAADPSDTQDRPVRRKAQAPKPAAPAATISEAPETVAPAPLATKAAPPAVPFEMVPEKERDAFVRRLELAERLIMEGRRAYDYRTTTTQDLQDALHSLSAE